MRWNSHAETLGCKNTLISSDCPHFTRAYVEKKFACPGSLLSGDIIPNRQWDVEPPCCYSRKKPQYGESNSLGPETAPITGNVG